MSLRLAPFCLVVLAGVVVAPAASGAVPRNSCRAADGVGSGELRHIAPFGNTRRITTELHGRPSLSVRATCMPAGPRGGWSITAVQDGHVYRSPRLGFADPVAILALYNYARGELPAILAQVGSGMTGQPYELWTFEVGAIVPATMTFTRSPPGSALAGGGAAEHGQGVFCSRHDRELLITQADWSGPGPGARSVTVTTAFGKGTSPAPTDPVTVKYARWTLEGQPLREVRFNALPSKTLTYAAAERLENVHC